MNKFILSSWLFTFSSFAAAYPACDLHQLKKVPLNINGATAELEVKIKGAPCYEATLEINIIVLGKVAYSYKAPFKPHVSIPWESLTAQDANDYISRIYEAYNFQNCSELLPVTLGDNSIYDYNNLLVSVKEYEKFKSSKCSVFIHQVNYESSRAVVFSSTIKKGIAVSEFGI